MLTGLDFLCIIVRHQSEFAETHNGRGGKIDDHLRRWVPGLSRWRMSSVPIELVYNVYCRALSLCPEWDAETGRTRVIAI